MGLKVWLAEVPLLGVLRSGPGDIRLGPDNFPVKQVLRGAIGAQLSKLSLRTDEWTEKRRTKQSAELAARLKKTRSFQIESCWIVPLNTFIRLILRMIQSVLDMRIDIKF